MQRGGEVRSWGDQELKDRLNEAKVELFNLRFQVVTGQLDNYARIKQVRREIARISTIARERDLSTRIEQEQE
jgi:large subunit ribosomal protein L29